MATHRRAAAAIDPLRAALALALAAALGACAGAPARAPAGTDGVAGVAPGAAAPSAAAAGEPPAYRALVVNQASDVVTRIGFTPGGGASALGDLPIGERRDEIEAAHGLRTAPDGRYWYVAISHGKPNGRVWKMDARSDTLLGAAQVGVFPGAMAVSRDGRFLFVTNMNIDGPPRPAPVSVVFTSSMTEVARVAACVLPAGNRLNESGTRDYTVCAGSDQLVEIDARRRRVSARFSLEPGAERRLADTLVDAPARSIDLREAACSPGWVTPGRGARANRVVYVACGGAGTLDEVDVRQWRLVRRIALDASPAGMAATPDGKLLLVALRDAAAVAVVDLDAGRVRARIPTSAPVPHGIVVTRDGRFAFVSDEGQGSGRGAVDVLDLSTLRRVASVEVRFQPGPIDVWGAR